MTGALAAELLRLSDIMAQTPSGPWKVTTREGRDIADEHWAESQVLAANGQPLALTYMSNVLEPADAEDVERFLLEARVMMPRLVAALEKALNWHPLHEDDPGACVTCMDLGLALDDEGSCAMRAEVLAELRGEAGRNA